MFQIQNNGYGNKNKGFQLFKFAIGFWSWLELQQGTQRVNSDKQIRQSLPSYRLQQRSAIFLCEGLNSTYFQLCRLYTHFTSPQLCHCSMKIATHDLKQTERAWLCSNKTFFIIIGQGPYLAHGPQSAGPVSTVSWGKYENCVVSGKKMLCYKVKQNIKSSKTKHI